MGLRRFANNEHHACTAQEAALAVRYDESSGLFYKVRPGGRVKVGSRTGSVCGNGYMRVRVNGREYLAHRLAWLIHYGQWPSGFVDHINGVITDNRIVNLREATPSQSTANTGLRRDNRCGFKGVTFQAHKRRKYGARIVKDGVTTWLGSFLTAEDAHAAYMKAAAEVFGEFARAVP